MEDTKIPLLKFLKLLTDNDVPASAAMSAAGKMYVRAPCQSACHFIVHTSSYKDYNTPARLRELTEAKLTAAGVGEKNTRKLIVSALHKAGYTKSPASLKRKHESEGQGPVAGPSSLPDGVTTVTEQASRVKRSSFSW